MNRKTRIHSLVLAIGALAALSPGARAQCEMQKLTASDAAWRDNFGNAVAVFGSTAVVGAAENDDAGGTSGSAYIFERTPAGWVETAKLTASDAQAGDAFGWSVSIWEDTVLVGAALDDDAAFSAGAVYVFERTPSGWMETDKLIASDAGTEDRFGWSVAVCGDRAVVGAVDDDVGAAQSGSAYVFELTPAGWIEAAKLTPDSPEAWDFFGRTVSICGDTALVGMHNDDDACPTDPNCDSGSAYVFERTGSGWAQTAKLTASDAAAGDWFGISVSLSGDKAIVGATCDDDAGSCSGSAYVFERSPSGNWGPNETTKLTASDAEKQDKFGTSVSLSGTLAVIGAHTDDDAGDRSGSAYIFELTPAGWFEKAKLVASDGSMIDLFGLRVSISGDTILIGAHSDDDACPSELTCDSGSAYIFAIPASLGQSYCGPAVANSTGRPAGIRACGSDESAGNYFLLRGSDLPVKQFGYFIGGQTQGFVSQPGSSQGNLCLGGKIGRFRKQIQNSGSAGTFSIFVDLTQMPPPVQQAVQPGETWSFQAWFRDKNPTPTSNFTDGVAVTF